MIFLNKSEPKFLLAGDFLFFLFSLWLSLLIRNGQLPSTEIFYVHLIPFSILFAVWICVYYIAGLYERHTTILQSKLPSILGVAQLTNSIVAIVFFYFVPFFGITPKTILFIYLIVSFSAILFWRTRIYFLFIPKKKVNAIMIGSGDEMKEILKEVNSNPTYSLNFITSIDLNRADEDGFWSEVIERIYSEDVSVVAVDLSNKNIEPILPHLYNLIFSNVNFIDTHKIYEDIFNRVPLSLLHYSWFLENISTTPRTVYDSVKRIIDLFLALILFLLSLPIYLLVFIAIKLDDGGPLFIYQERVGGGNKLIKIIKFRSMSHDDRGNYKEKEINHVTRVGFWIRKTRIDELPQLINVLKGDLSLVGPRPELPTLVKKYSEEIPYYNVRHLIKPGLSGWAQIYHDAHPHHRADVNETKNKLAYDLFYIKNRSILIDLKIALRTLKIIASISGR